MGSILQQFKLSDMEYDPGVARPALREEPDEPRSAALPYGGYVFRQRSHADRFHLDLYPARMARFHLLGTVANAKVENGNACGRTP
jgi:hypothetical protein